MSDENFNNDFNFKEETVPTAEVEEFMPDQSSEPNKFDQAQPKSNNSADFIPTETKVWHYCLRDLTDEFFWAIIFCLVWFGIGRKVPQSHGWLTAYWVLTFLFALGISYFSIFIYTPLNIFFRKRNKENNPNTNSLLYDLTSFVIFVTAILVLASRIIAGSHAYFTLPSTVPEAPPVAESSEGVPEEEAAVSKEDTATTKEPAPAEEPAP
ncbi:MAG: hypothetical protein Q4A17_14140, partial [Thermoguttaceae bacterium]|nr:hypothetical protein [Thermoguttaceae bacterium]